MLKQVQLILLLAFITQIISCKSTRKKDLREMPELAIRPGSILELVSGSSGGLTVCFDATGKRFEHFKVSDVIYRIQEGYLEKEQNAGCPPAIETNKKLLSNMSLAKISDKLQALSISVATNEACAVDLGYAGFRLITPPQEKKFVHVLPKSAISCRGDFTTTADWNELQDFFKTVFENE